MRGIIAQPLTRLVASRRSTLSPKGRGVTYAQLVEHLSAMGIVEAEANVRNKLSRGKFTAAYLLQCLEAIDSSSLHLD